MAVGELPNWGIFLVLNQSDEIPQLGSSPTANQDLSTMLMSIGQFPDSWKVARVIPVYKDDPTDDRSNNGPISVLRVAAKLLRSFMNSFTPIFMKTIYFSQAGLDFNLTTPS